MRVTKRTILYLGLLVASVLVALDIWYVTNIIQARQVGFLLWEGGLAILLFLIAGLLAFKYMPSDSRARTGIFIVLGIFIFDILVMLNYATTAALIEKLTYYFHVILTASVFVLVAMVGNIVGVEKKTEEGFAIHLHARDSPIPPKLILPVWLMVFFAMGGLVMASGHVLLSYPQFGILSFLGGPATSGFGVGDGENICFLVFPFAISFGLAKLLKMPTFPAFLMSLIIGMVVFTIFHSLVYATNMLATLIIMIFGGISLASYHYTKSVVVMSALHIGNNFWGALFKVNVIGFSVLGVATPMSTIIFSVTLLIGMVVSIYLLIRRFGTGRRS